MAKIICHKKKLRPKKIDQEILCTKIQKKLFQKKFCPKNFWDQQNFVSKF